MTRVIHDIHFWSIYSFRTLAPSVLQAVNNPSYDYTWNSDRRWAKNRQPTENFLCPGISLNNNFDYKWDEQENTNPCSGKRIQNFDHANSSAEEQDIFFLKTH